MKLPTILAAKKFGDEGKRDSSGFVAKSREPIREIYGNPAMYAKYKPGTWFVRYRCASTLPLDRKGAGFRMELLGTPKVRLGVPA